MADMYGDYADYNGYGVGGAYQASFGYGRGPQGAGAGAYNPYPSHGPPTGYAPSAGAFNADPGYQQSPLDAEVASVIHEMRNEISSFEAAPEFSDQYRNAKRLLVHEVGKLESNTDPEWLEVDIDKQIKLVKKVLIPAFRYPRFNFIGKIIGPKGVTLQNIAKTFKCHVYVLGRGSSRDKAKEQELLATGDPQYAHFNGPLHVKIETTAPPAMAYKRIAGVLEILQELLQPVKESYIEGITPMPESMKKDTNNEEGNNDDEDIKKEPGVEESKIKIDKDYGPDLEAKTPVSSSRGGNHGSGGFSRGAPRGGFNSSERGNRGGPGGPMRRGGMGSSMGAGGNAGHFATPGYGGPMRGRGGSGERGFGGPMRGRGGSGERGFGGPMRGRGGSGDRGFGGRGRGGDDRGRFQPY